MSDVLRDNLLTFVLGGGNLFLIVKFFIERHDKKKERAEFNLKDEISKIKKDGIRTQLLVMICFKPDERKEILTLGENYFDKLKGNWYMTSIFNKWLDDTGTAKPEWFKGEQSGKTDN